MAKNGLVHITTASFTTQASVSIDNCFSATYTHYLVKRNLLGSVVGQNIAIRLRAASTDASAGNYRRQNFLASSTSLSSSRSTTDTSWLACMGYTETTSYGYSETWISNPFEAVRSTAWVDYAATHDAAITLWHEVYAHDPTTSYDGFTVIPNTGTITGSISVWGLVKS